MANTATLRVAAVAATVTIALPLAACGANSGGTDRPSRSPANGTPVTRDQAGKIVTDAYGGQVKNVEPDHEQGRATWEVEVTNSRKGRIEVDVARRTGKILALEKD